MKSNSNQATSVKNDSLTLDVLIVNYNSFDDCSHCIDSIIKHGVASFENIIVVDNMSPDGSGAELARKFPKVRVILSGKNEGFSAGVNIAASAASAEYLLILNPDTKFEDNKIPEALSLFTVDPKLGILGLNLVNPDGSPQYSARRFYSVQTLLARRTALGKCTWGHQIVAEHLMTSEWSNDSIFEADWVMGTGFIIRREFFFALGGMDEEFFLYLEDTDLCARAWKLGFTVKAIPKVRLIHDHRRQSATSLLSRAGRAHLRSLAVYIKKHGMPLLKHGQR